MVDRVYKVDFVVLFFGGAGKKMLDDDDSVDSL